MNAMLELTNIHKTFNKGTINEKKAVQGLNLTLNSGDFVTVIGGNGAGKSTMLNMIAGVYPIDRGTIILNAGARQSQVFGKGIPGSHEGDGGRDGD